MGCRVYGLEFGVQGSGLRVQGLGLRAEGLLHLCARTDSPK